VPVKLLLRGTDSDNILRDFLRNCSSLDDLWTDEARLNLARDLLLQRVDSEAHLDAVSRMARTFFGPTGRPEAPAVLGEQRNQAASAQDETEKVADAQTDLPNQWYQVRCIPGLSPEWKLRLAQRLFTTPSQTARERFLEEVRQCIQTLAPTVSGDLLSALGNLLCSGSSSNRADET